MGASRMRAPTVSVDQALPVVGSYFIPAPRSMEAADARIWGASRLAVASPAPIANREFMAGGSADGVSPPHRLMLMLTSRLSRVHSLQHNEEYKLRPVQGDRLLQSIQPLRLQKGAVCSEVLFQIALNGGLRSPMLRSDQCWVGGAVHWIRPSHCQIRQKFRISSKTSSLFSVPTRPIRAAR